MNSVLEKYNITKLPGDLIKILRSFQFNSSEILVILVCLTSLDGADCLTVPPKDIIETTGVSKRVFYHTLEKMITYDVERVGKRYCFTGFINYLQRIEGI